MRRVWVLLLVVAACRSHDLDLLDNEIRRFKVENETIRAEDLEARFEKQKARADALSKRLLALAQEREDRYAEYDGLKKELASLRRRRAAAAKEKAALEKSLQQLAGDIAKMKAQLAKERKAADPTRAPDTPAEQCTGIVRVSSFFLPQDGRVGSYFKQLPRQCAEHSGINGLGKPNWQRG